MPDKITELYAFICTDTDGNEGIPATLIGDYYCPLVGADTARAHSLRDKAQTVADFTGRPVRLAIFRQMEVIEEIQPTATENT